MFGHRHLQAFVGFYEFYLRWRFTIDYGILWDKSGQIGLAPGQMPCHHLFFAFIIVSGGFLWIALIEYVSLKLSMNYLSIFMMCL